MFVVYLTEGLKCTLVTSCVNVRKMIQTDRLADRYRIDALRFLLSLILLLVIHRATVT